MTEEKYNSKKYNSKKYIKPEVKLDENHFEIDEACVNDISRRENCQYFD